MQLHVGTTVVGADTCDNGKIRTIKCDRFGVDAGADAARCTQVRHRIAISASMSLLMTFAFTLASTIVLSKANASCHSCRFACADGRIVTDRVRLHLALMTVLSEPTASCHSCLFVCTDSRTVTGKFAFPSC